MTSDDIDNSVNEIIDFIGVTYGENAKRIFSRLYELGREITDHELAEMMQMHEAEVRKILYQLSEERFVSVRRVRDRETNYYIYYWKLNTREIPRAILNRKKLALEIVKKRLEFEEKKNFYCPRCGREYTSEEALANEFTCPYCSEILLVRDKSSQLKSLKDLVKLLENEMRDEERKILSRSG
ncbi:MAG: transcription factor [Sulfolobales archaeon]